MAYLVDTNILVYAYDPRFPDKQSIARRILRDGIASGEVRVAHQAILEFIAATTRGPRRGEPPIMTPDEARMEGELMLSQYDVLYPDEQVLRLAIRGFATYPMSWFDAHMWAYAEANGLDTLYSEDLQHSRQYGTVRIINPFITKAAGGRG